MSLPSGLLDEATIVYMAEADAAMTSVGLIVVAHFKSGQKLI